MRRTPIRPSLVQAYRRFLDDHDRCGYMRAVAQRYSEGTLQRLAINGDRVTRRAATLALGLIGSHGSTEVLGQALHDVDRAVRVVAEDGLRSLWARAVGPAGVYAIARISRWNFGHLYDLAADGCEELLEKFPQFGEAWHQLGIACMGVGDHSRARHALTRCLILESQHFLASQRLARVLLAAGDPLAALQRLGDTLDIHPHFEPVRLQMEQLRRSWT